MGIHKFVINKTDCVAKTVLRFLTKSHAIPYISANNLLHLARN